MYFEYGDQEIAHLRKRDKRLSQAIDQIGPIRREVDGDLFASLIKSIVGQQISTAAQQTVWKRMCESLGEVTAKSVYGASLEALQANGITFKKAGYIKGFADKVMGGQLDLQALQTMDDEWVIKELTALDGIGVWTAEMLLTFCLQRPDVLSFGDLAIHRGMRMLYRHKEISRERFERYRRRYSPYGSVASLYLWAIAGGAIKGLSDPLREEKKR